MKRKRKESKQTTTVTLTETTTTRRTRNTGTKATTNEASVPQQDAASTLQYAPNTTRPFLARHTHLSPTWQMVKELL
jgi:hypothetical protein